MNNKNIIIAGAIAVGLYLFSQTKTTAQEVSQEVAQKVAQRTRSTATPAIRKRTAQKIAQKIAQKVAQKVVKEKDEYVRERTPPTLATVIQKRTGVPVSEARRIAEKIAYERARKQRERIAAANRAVLKEAKRKRIEIAEANRKAAARKKLIHRAVEVLPRVSLHNLLNIIKTPTTKKTTPKAASPMRHKTTHSSWTPTAWPVHIVHKKATLFDYSKPQKKKDLSELHTAIKWRRALTPPRPKSSIRKALALKKQRARMLALYAKADTLQKRRLFSAGHIPHRMKLRPRKNIQKVTLNKSSTDKRKKMQEILSRRKYPLYWLRPRRHVVMRRR